MSDRAAALAPYAEQLINNRDVQDAIRRAAGAGRDTVQRARGQGPAKAVKDKRLRQRVKQTAEASWDVWTAVESGAARRGPRWGRRIVLVTLAAAGTFVALNTEARQTVLSLVSNTDTSSSNA